MLRSKMPEKLICYKLIVVSIKTAYEINYKNGTKKEITLGNLGRQISVCYSDGISVGSNADKNNNSNPYSCSVSVGGFCSLPKKEKVFEHSIASINSITTPVKLVELYFDTKEEALEFVKTDSGYSHHCYALILPIYANAKFRQLKDDEYLCYNWIDLKINEYKISEDELPITDDTILRSYLNIEPFNHKRNF